MKWGKLAGMAVAVAAALACLSAAAADKKKIMLVAGPPATASDPGAHEFRAGALLLQKWLDQVPGVEAVVFTNGWPEATNAFDGAAAVVLYMSGGAGHAAFEPGHLAQLRAAMAKGAGFACFHHTIEVPTSADTADFLAWMGGCFEPQTSKKEFWDAEFKTLPVHPITRGVKPFTLRDEWYHHLRFADTGVTPILSAAPPENGQAGTAEQVVAWAYERPDGGRGFGTSGGHYHKNWGDENFRKLVLNGLLWIAKVEVPPDGVQSAVTAEELTQNLDVKGQRR